MNTENLKSILISVGLMIGGAMISFLVTWFWFVKNTKQKLTEKQEALTQRLVDKVTELDKQLAAVVQQVTPISSAFQAILIKELTHFHTPVMDELMAKAGPPYLLTEEEEQRLISELTKRAQDMSELIPESERDAATMLPFVMKRVRAELNAATPLDLKLVAVPLDPSKT